MKERFRLKEEAKRKKLEDIRQQAEEAQQRQLEDQEAAHQARLARQSDDSDTASEGSGFSDVSVHEEAEAASLILDGPDLDIPANESEDEAAEPIPPDRTPREEVVQVRRDSFHSTETGELSNPDECASPTIISHNDDSNRVLLQIQIQDGGYQDNSARQVVVRLRPDWAPSGAARFEELVEAGFYNGTRFHRVVTGALAQFGLPADPTLYTQWKSRLLVDDAKAGAPHIGNSRGTISFAENKKDARCCQVFVNLIHNKAFDNQGFIPIAEIVQGMDIMDDLCNSYGDIPPKGKGPDPAQIKELGLRYLTSKYPLLSFISEAKVLSRSGDVIRRPSLKKVGSTEKVSEESTRKISFTAATTETAGQTDSSEEPNGPAGSGFKAAQVLRTSL